MSYCLFISSSHQYVQHMTSQILLILIDFDRVFDHFFRPGGGWGKRHPMGKFLKPTFLAQFWGAASMMITDTDNDQLNY